MSYVPVAQRRLYMHPAHAVVGVSNALTIFRPARLQERFSVAWNELALRVTLVSGEIDGRIADLLLRLQRMLQGRLDAECRCAFIDVAEGLAELEAIEQTDCTVLLYQGITILKHRSAWDPELLGDGCPVRGDGQQAEIAVVPASRRHPVLDGVGPFISRSGMPTNTRLPTDGACLLLGQEGTACSPVAWARESRGRQFHTSLGSGDDFQQSSFCRLLINAVSWVADAEGNDGNSDA